MANKRADALGERQSLDENVQKTEKPTIAKQRRYVRDRFSATFKYTHFKTWQRAFDSSASLPLSLST